MEENKRRLAVFIDGSNLYFKLKSLEIKNLYDETIIISSDTDLIPAMQKIKQLGKKVEYIGFGHQPSLALQTFATISRLLIKEELEPFIHHE